MLVCVLSIVLLAQKICRGSFSKRLDGEYSKVCKIDAGYKN